MTVFTDSEGRQYEIIVGHGTGITHRLPFRTEMFANDEGVCCDQMVFHESWVENVYRFNEAKLTGLPVIDLGANIGAFTLLALATDLGCEVLAIEPMVSNISLLMENLKLNDGFFERCRIVHAATGLEEGWCHMEGEGTAARMNVISEDSLPNFSIDNKFGIVNEYSDDGSFELKVHGRAPNAAVPMTNLDHLLDTFDIDEVDFLKMDIEWGEYPTIEGANCLDRVRHIAMEWHPAEDQLGRMITKLLHTHAISGIIGTPKTGGMLWANRHDV